MQASTGSELVKNLVVTAPNNLTLTDPFPKRLFGTHWCGAGGAGPTVNSLDAACQQHDACYDTNHLSAGMNWGIGITQQNIGPLQSCNQQLCSAASKTSDPGSTRVVMTSTGLGMDSYLKAPTELAATSAGWGWAKWIPFAGAAADVYSAYHDGRQAYSDYSSCMAGH